MKLLLEGNSCNICGSLANILFNIQKKNHITYYFLVFAQYTSRNQYDLMVKLSFFGWKKRLHNYNLLCLSSDTFLTIGFSLLTWFKNVIHSFNFNHLLIDKLRKTGKYKKNMCKSQLS